MLQDLLELPAEFELDQTSHFPRLLLRSEFSAPICLKPLGELDYHKNFFYKNSIYTQPFAKALGVKKGKKRPKVLDASAGTLKDTCLMLAMGLEVIACERHPVAQALISNCLSFTDIEGLEFIPTEASALVKSRADFDVIYFDPMYEQKNEKAAPRKEMRIFRELIDSDLDAADIANSFRLLGKRLVIKRSSKAIPLLPGPHMSFGRKSTAYDVYL